MFKSNIYNIEYEKKRLKGYLVFLNCAEALYIYITNFSTYEIVTSFPLPFFFLLIWLYTYLWHIKLKKLSDIKERKELFLKINGEKRECHRFEVGTDCPIRVKFSVIKCRYLLEFKKRKVGILIDISESGVRIKTDCNGIVEGGRAFRMVIKFPQIKSIKVDGLIVRVDNRQCGIMFINISKYNKKIITDYIFNRLMNGTGTEKKIMAA